MPTMLNLSSMPDHSKTHLLTPKYVQASGTPMPEITTGSFAFLLPSGALNFHPQALLSNRRKHLNLQKILVEENRHDPLRATKRLAANTKSFFSVRL